MEVDISYMLPHLSEISRSITANKKRKKERKKKRGKKEMPRALYFDIIYTGAGTSQLVKGIKY